VRRCYRFLAETYEEGDKLFLFGFSRGAYTARSLAGLIRNCGVLRPENVDQVDAAFAFYRDRSSRTHPSGLASQLFRSMYSYDEDDIHFIGVWDTVGALGIPIDLPGLKGVAERLWGFHDTQLSSHVRFAYHALAIDEQRAPFRPTLWTGAPAQGQTLEQVWFSGVHSEVGGGSKDASLSDIALLWMVDRARSCGLMVKADQLQPGASAGLDELVTPDYAGPIVNSRRGLYTALRAYQRLERLRPLPPGGAPGQSIASAAQRRFADRVDGYAPPGLGEYLAALEITAVDDGTRPPG
jgi:uncharacterized protein (DUF2235 family)